MRGKYVSIVVTTEDGTRYSTGFLHAKGEKNIVQAVIGEIRDMTGGSLADCSFIAEDLKGKRILTVGE